MRLLTALAGLAAAVGLAAPAHADPDADFLAALNHAGITYQSGPDAVGIGRRACDLMSQGHPEADVIKGMTEQNSGFTTAGATQFTKLAEGAYCPQYPQAIPPQPPPPPQQPSWPGFPLPPLPAAR